MGNVGKIGLNSENMAIEAQKYKGLAPQISNQVQYHCNFEPFFIGIGGGGSVSWLFCG